MKLSNKLPQRRTVKFSRNQLASAVAVAILAPWSSGPVLAQTAAASAQPAANDAQQIIITSGKRRQVQRDVAGTVTALDGAKLESLGSTDLEDVLKLTPGVQFNKGAADASLLSIRGISTNSGSNTQGFTQAPTGIYIEDVPFTDPFAFVSSPDLAPFDLERVEVLRGPQGALYGSSSLGGAIRYILKKPNTNSQEGSITGSLSRNAKGEMGWSTSAMGNIPLADGKAGLRFVVNGRKDAGFIDNIGTKVENSNSNRVDGGRVIFTYKPDNDFDLTAIYLNQKSAQADGSSISSFDYETGKGYSLKPPTAYEVKTAFPQKSNSSFDLSTIQFNKNIGDFKLTSLTGYQTKQRKLNEDFSRDFFDPAYLGDKWTSDTNLNTKTASQEIRLSPVKSGNINWLIGAFWMDSTVARDQQVFLEPRTPGSPDLRFRRNGRATEKAFFADVEAKLSDKMTAGLGARYYNTSLNYDRITGTAENGTVYPYGSDDKGTTPKLSLRYQVNTGLSTYVLASRGYRFGGISNLGTNPIGRPYKSDSILNYETGVRWTPSNTLSLDASIFHIDWKDVQMAELYKDPATNRQFLVTGNIGKAKSQGIEFSGAWKPESTVSLRAAVAYTDASTAGGLTIGGVSVADGTPLPGTAKLQTTLEASKAFEGPYDSSGRLSALYAYTGKRKAQIDSSMELPAYSTLDLRLTFSWSKTEISAFANNLMNSKGMSSAIDFFPPLFTEFYPIRPRTVGVSVRRDF